jgi:CAAX protease family protein
MTMWGRLFSGPAAYEPQTGWPAWAVLPAALVILLLPLLIGIAVLAVYGGLAGASAVQAETAAEMLVQHGLLFAGLQVGVIVLTWLAAGFFSSERRQMLALRAPAGGWSALPIAFLPLLLGTTIWTGAIVMWNPEVVIQDLKPFQEMLNTDIAWLFLLVICVGAPISEEFLFRGFVFSGLAKTRLGFVGTSIVTTVLWTALHANYSVFGLIEVLGIGLYLSWVLIRTGSLWVTIFCHAVYNSVVALALLTVSLNT